MTKKKSYYDAVYDPECPRTYAALRELATGRIHKKLAGHTYVRNETQYIQAWGKIETPIIRYHATDIITYLPDDSVIVKTGGWNTMTTAERLHKLTPPYLRFNHSRKYDEIYVTVLCRRASVSVFVLPERREEILFRLQDSLHDVECTLLPALQTYAEVTAGRQAARFAQMAAARQRRRQEQTAASLAGRWHKLLEYTILTNNEQLLRAHYDTWQSSTPEKPATPVREVVLADVP